MRFFKNKTEVCVNGSMMMLITMVPMCAAVGLIAQANALRLLKEPRGLPIVQSYIQEALRYDQGQNISPRVPEMGTAVPQVEHHSDKQLATDEKSTIFDASASESTHSSGEESAADHASGADGEEASGQAGSRSERTSEEEAPEAESNKSKESNIAPENGDLDTSRSLARKRELSAKESLHHHTPADAAALSPQVLEGSAAHVSAEDKSSSPVKESADEIKAKVLHGNKAPSAAQAYSGDGQARKKPWSASAGLSSRAVTEKSDHKMDIRGSKFLEATIPSPSNFVVQLNFRPSMVIGKAEADMAERHVIQDKGKHWYQVFGTKDLTILKLQPMEDENLLHQETVAQQPY